MHVGLAEHFASIIEARDHSLYPLCRILCNDQTPNKVILLSSPFCLLLFAKVDDTIYFSHKFDSVIHVHVDVQGA